MGEDKYEVYEVVGGVYERAQLVATMLDLEMATLLVRTWFEKYYADTDTCLVVKRMSQDKYEVVSNWKYWAHSEESEA